MEEIDKEAGKEMKVWGRRRRKRWGWGRSEEKGRNEKKKNG
jgi:hypothetical protein